MEYKIVYQTVPFNYNRPSCLVIKAPNAVEAFLGAYDLLTRKGFAVSLYIRDIENKAGLTSGEAREVLTRINSQLPHGDTHIVGLEPHTVEAEYSLVAG